MICNNCGCPVVPSVATKVKHLNGVYINPEEVIKICLEYFGYNDFKQLTKFSRDRPLPYHRFVTMTFLKKKSSLGSVEIGKMFNRDHTSVLHGIQVIEDLMYSDPKVLHEVNELNKKLNGIAIHQPY